MEAFPFLSEGYPLTQEQKVRSLEMHEGTAEAGEAEQAVMVLSEYSTDQRLVAHHFYAGNHHLGITMTLEVADARDDEYTYRLWFDGKNYGEMDVHPAAHEGVTYVDWPGIGDEMRDNDAEWARGMMVATLGWLPLDEAIRRDFKTSTIEYPEIG